MPENDTLEEEDSYESMTVAELREELAARDLHTSGNKDELIARLEENDAAEEAEQTPEDEEEPEETDGEEEEAGETDTDLPPADPDKRIYSPYELPVDPFAAQAFMTNFPNDVDTSLTLDPTERQEMAEANIQDIVDYYASVGVTVDDPRLSGS
jgi:SAP domain